MLAVLARGFITHDLGGGSLRGAHSGMRGLLGALYRGTDGALGPVRRFVEGVPHAGSNQDTIDHLRAENAQLRAKLADEATDRSTAKQLARLQLTADRNDRKVLPARVIALGPGAGFDWTVTLDVGVTSGVRVGQTVTDGLGLVGRVLHADQDTSVVLLAADPDSGVGVRDVRTGETGLAKGRGTDGFSVTPLKPGSSMRVGDVIETGPSGASSFVAGIRVGVVTAVTPGGGTAVASVRPTASPTALDLVGIILDPGSAGVARSALTPVADTTPSDHTGTGPR
ncbi:MAG: rod shape-determining protein MreC [Jatrophihabitans sp.]|uniref:rod shape-determining protein MreC n=1 Tax=Jatrophihabitans sp. TaxID=1932789 RepID=UPI003F80FE02